MLMTLLCCIAMPQVVMAQNCVEFGEGTTAGSGSLPVASYYHYSYTQQLFTADEIDYCAGNIVSIGFQYNNTSSMTRKISIYMANTTAESMTTSFIRENLVEVLSPTVITFDNTEDWVVIDLENTFAYSGENLVVAVYQEQSTEETLYSSGSRFLTFSSTGMSCYKQSDTQFTLGNDHAPTGTGSALSYRTNTQFCFSTPCVKCDKPASIVPSDTTANTMTLTWAGGSGAYNLEYKAKDDTVWTVVLTQSTLLSTTLTGLEPNTDYQARVQSYCSALDTISSWKTCSFKTACASISSFPWSEDFESYAGSKTPDCWDISESTSSSASGTSFYYIWGVVSGTNNKMMRMYNSLASKGTARSTMPTIVMPESGSYEMSFDYVHAASCGPFKVLASTDGGQTWDTIGTYAMTTTSASTTTPSTLPNEAIISLDNYVGQTIQLQFFANANYGSGAIFVDNIAIYDASCVKPTELTAGAITTTSVALSWDADPAQTAWQLEYKKSADKTWTPVQVTTNPYTLTGLDIYTAYDFRVAAKCGENISKYSNQVSAKTAAKVPFAEAFTSLPSDWKRYKVALDSVWAGVDTLVNHPVSAGWAVSTGNGVYGASHLKLNVYGTSVMNWIVSPFIEMDDNMQLSFDLALTKASGTLTPAEAGQQEDDKFYVLVTTDEGETWNELYVRDNTTSADSYDNINCSADGQNVKIDMTAYATDKIAIAFYGESTVTGGDNYLHIRNLVIDTIPSCTKPEALAVTALSDTLATFTWDEVEGATWAYCLTTDTAASFKPTDADFTGSTTDYTVTFDTLQENTDYVFFLRQDCGNSHSDYVVRGIHTIQTPTAIPYADDFEAGNNWLLINGDLENAWAYGTAAHNGEGTHALYISNNNGVANAYTVTKAAAVYAIKSFEFAEEGTYTFKYDWKANGESNYDFIRVALVPADVQFTAGTALPTGVTYQALPTGWIALDGGTKLNLSNAWKTFSADVEVQAGLYNVVILWKDDTSGGTQTPAAIDNFSIKQLLCARPEDVALAAGGDSIATNYAKIDWEAQGAEANWLVQYKKHADSVWTVIAEPVTAHPYVLAGLEASTMYDVQVAAWCNLADSATISEYTDVFSFVTECDAIAEFPYSENFDGIEGTTSGTANILPICWNYINTCTYSSYTGYPLIYKGSSSAASGENSLRFYSYAYSSTYDPQDQYAILPEMEGLNALRMKFNARAYSTGSSYSAAFIVGVMSDPADTATFEALAYLEPTTTTYVPFEVKFNSYTGTGKYIAIKMLAGDLVNDDYIHGCYIDNIVVDSIPDCYEPVAVKVLKSTTTSVQFTFTPAEENNDSLSYAIVAKGTQPTAFVGVTADTMSVDGLTAGTEYELYLRSECTNSHSKAISVVFMTKPLPVEVGASFVDDFEGTTQWLLENGTLTNAWVHGTAAHNGEGSTKALYISNDGGATNAYSHSATTVYAMKPFIFANASYVFQYDWKAKGESSYDYIRVALVPDSVELAAGTTLPTGVTATALPANLIALDGGSKLNLIEVWDTLQTEEIAVKAGTYNVVFMWRNDGSGGTQPPAAIDNFSITKILCGKPSKPTIDKANITATTAEIVWEAQDGQTAWQLAMDTLKNFNPDSVAPIAVTKDTFQATGLLPEHTYYVYVRTNCGEDGFSAWSDVASFKSAKLCQKPDGLVISAITDSSAVVTWNTYGQSDFRITYGIGNEYADSVDVVDGTYTITGLTENTSYKVKVASACDLTTWSSAKTFKTKCLPVAAVEENFDGITGVTSGHAMVDCWEYINLGTNSTYNYYPTVYKGESYAASGENSLKFYSYFSSSATTTTEDQYAILPAMNNISSLRIKFQARKNSASYDGSFTIGVMTDPTDTATYVVIDSLSTSSVAYEPFKVMFDSYTGEGKYIAIKMDKPVPAGTATYAYRGIYVDDVVVEAIPSCVEPEKLAVVELGTDSAKLDWVSSASEWQICLNNDSVNLIDVSEKPYILRNLTPATKYTFMVRAICAVGDTSAWSNTISFTTECNLISLADSAYAQDFESFEGTAYNVAGVTPTCWEVGGTSTYTPHVVDYSVSTSYAYYHSGTKSLNFCGSANSYAYAILPDFVESLNRMQIEFWYRMENASYGTLSLCYLSGDTLYTLKTFSNVTTMTYTDELRLDTIPANAEKLAILWQYTGSSFYSCCIDDIKVSLIPPCPKSTGLHVEALTDSTATFAWDAEEDVTWECGVVVDTAATFVPTDADFTYVTDTNVVVIDSLAETTDYLFFMRKVCGEDKSVILYQEFTTSQKPVAVPFFDDFESGNNWMLINGELENKWVHGSAVNNGGQYSLYISNDGGTSHAYTVNKSASVFATKAIEIAEDGNYTFSYDWLANGESNYDYIRVALVPADVQLTASTTIPTGVTATALPTGWIALDGASKLNLATDWANKSVTVPVSAGLYKIVILWRDDTSSGSQAPAAIDNFSVVQALCEVPTDLNASDLTTNSATLDWTSDAEAWQLVYSENADFVPDSVASIAVTTKPYILGNLLAETTYYYAVRTKCGDDFFSAWSAISSFSTPAPCVTKYEEVYDTICPNTVYEWNGRELTEAGEYVDSLQTAAGCDSIATLHLAIYAEEEPIHVSHTIKEDELPFEYETAYIAGQTPISYPVGTEPGIYVDSVLVEGEHCVAVLVHTLTIEKSQGFENIYDIDGSSVQKVLYHDVLYIICNDEWYNAEGKKVSDPRQ